MKNIITIMMALLIMLAIPAPDIMAQSKTKAKTTSTAKGKKTSKNTKGKKGKKGKDDKPVVQLTELPYNSNDCLYAITLNPDVPYGPTNVPNGGGRVMEITRDKSNPNVFEIEHNTAWFKFKVPYSGKLIVNLTPQDPKDDYDFLVYRYTDQYFQNQLISGRAKPVLSNLSEPDSATKGAIGVSLTGRNKFIPKTVTDPNCATIDVSKDEYYYLVVDKPINGGKGFTLKVSVSVDCFTPTITFHDPKLRKNVDVDILLIEKNTDNRVVMKNPSFKGGKVSFVPKFDYVMYVKKDGYFSIYKEFNADIFKEDTLMKITMNKIERGSRFQINEVYFEDGETKLLVKESENALITYLQMFKNQPEVFFTIKGYVASYGFDVDQDVATSLGRAESVRQYFIDNGIEGNRMCAQGMTKSEVKKAAAEVLNNKGYQFKDVRIEIIITGIEKF
ncbi:MAG: OmpA family protein [Bacteroidales bacterium]|nr:OmpA family protein [Bacteroidales bacterium]